MHSIIPVQVFFFLALALTSYSQTTNDGVPQVVNYKRADYKGGTQNWGIDQDKNGVIYFANNGGLLQFNGTSWNKYQLPNRSQVRSIKTGDSNRVYVGGYDEFGFFQPNNKGVLFYHSLKPLLGNAYRNPIDFIWKIHRLGNQVVFQAFSSAFVYDGKSLTTIKPPSRFQFSFLVNNRLYFQDVESGLMEYRDGRLVPLPTTNALNSTEVWSMVALNGNCSLITTQYQGLRIYQSNKLEEWNTEASQFLKKNGCLGGVAIQKNRFAFNSVLDGVIICDTAGRILRHLNQKNGLQNNTILYSFTDNSGNVWLGLDNGIDFINENSPLSYFGSSFNLGTVYASALYENKLYVATNQGLYYQSWNQPLNANSFKLVEGTTGQAWNIQVVDSTLFCSHNNGLFVIKNDKVYKKIDNTGYWNVKEVAFDKNKILGANYNGFGVFVRGKEGWVLRNHLNEVSKSAGNFQMADGILWMVMDSLLYQLKPGNDLMSIDNINTYKILPGTASPITGIHRLNDQIIFQSEKRFYTFSRPAARFVEEQKMTAMFQSLPQPKYLKEDERGNIWYVSNQSIGMLTNKGGDRFQNTTEPFINLKNNLEYDYISINTIDASNVFIGLTNGLAHINLSRIGKVNVNPPATITGVYFPNDTIQPLGLPDLSFAKPKIAFRHNSVRFSFGAPAYSHLETLEFAYKLKGFEEGWSNWTAEHVKEYSNLREGTYTMCVKYRISGENESEPAEFSFMISPPFYRHPLAYALYLIVIGVSIFLIRNSIKAKIRKNKYYETLEQRKIYLEKENKNKLEQLELLRQIEELKIEKLQMSLEAKDRELVTNSFQVVKKNSIINGILQKIKKANEEATEETTKVQLQRLSKTLAKELDSERSWRDLEKHIKNVHFDFLRRLKERFPEISSRELDLATYLLMNMSSKEISAFMNISIESVELARYRLRKKLGLSRDQNLVGFLMSI